MVFTGKRLGQIEKNPQSPRSQAIALIVSFFVTIYLILIKVEFFFLKNSSVSPMWIFIFDTSPAQIYSLLQRKYYESQSPESAPFNNEELVHVIKLEVSYNLKKR
jgi:hypothetical protein